MTDEQEKAFLALEGLAGYEFCLDLENCKVVMRGPNAVVHASGHYARAGASHGRYWEPVAMRDLDQRVVERLLKVAKRDPK